MLKRRPTVAARLLALVAMVVVLVVSAIRVPPVCAAVAGLSTIEANGGDAHSYEAIPTRDGELPAARAFRPQRTTDLSTRLRDVALGSIEQSSNGAFVAEAPSGTLGTRGSPLKAWTTSSPTPAELMVFLN